MTGMTLKSSVLIFQVLEPLQPPLTAVASATSKTSKTSRSLVHQKIFFERIKKVAHSGYVRDPTALTIASLVRVRLLSCVASSTVDFAT